MELGSQRSSNSEFQSPEERTARGVRATGVEAEPEAIVCLRVSSTTVLFFRANSVKAKEAMARARRGGRGERSVTRSSARRGRAEAAEAIYNAVELACLVQCSFFSFNSNLFGLAYCDGLVTLVGCRAGSSTSTALGHSTPLITEGQSLGRTGLGSLSHEGEGLRG